MISAENYRGQKVLINEITEKIIGAAIDVHRALGPGLLESAYTACLTFELAERGLTCETGTDTGPLQIDSAGVRVPGRSDSKLIGDR
jgi:GxxExxY protein